MMRKLNLFLFIILLASPSYALLGFDEFTDDANITISETVENNLGQTCTDCNTSLWLNYPNGSLRNFSLMKYNTTSTKYDSKKLIPYLVNQNTTIYTLRITANRTVSGNVFRSISDRTIITIYDIFPPVDSQWDVGIVLIFIIIQWAFVFMAYRFHDEHIMIKYAFFAIALFLNSFLLGLGQRILAINSVTTPKFINMVDSAEVIGIYLNYIFTAYVILYLIYYLVNNVLKEGKGLTGRLSRKDK
jgi:hypothetical protein